MSTPITLEDYGTAFGHNTHAHLFRGSDDAPGAEGSDGGSSDSVGETEADSNQLIQVGADGAGTLVTTLAGQSDLDSGPVAVRPDHYLVGGVTEITPLEIASPAQPPESSPAPAVLDPLAELMKGIGLSYPHAPTLGAESVTDAQSPEATADASPLSTDDVPPASETPGETPAEQLSEEQYTDASRRVAVILTRLEDTPANRQWAWLRALNGVGVKDAAGLAATFAE